MKRYSFFRSSAEYRLRMAFNLRGLVAEKAFVHLRKLQESSPEFLRMNPLGLVPVFEEEGQIFTQSLAIIGYLDETHPEPPLLPKSPADRVFVRALALVIESGIHPLNNLRVLNYLQNDLGVDAAAKDWGMCTG